MPLPKSLVDGHVRFRRDVHAKDRGRYRQLAELGQAPTAMVIACCDARVDVSAIFDAEAGADTVLRDFADELNARGFRVVGMVQAGQCADSSLSAVLVHSGETLLLAQDFDPAASGCRLDLGRLQNAGERVAEALEAGADLLIVNRFGKRERDGKGLSHLIQRALDVDIPVVIAVSQDRIADWIKFAGGMTVKLPCDRNALDTWWQKVSA